MSSVAAVSPRPTIIIVRPSSSRASNDACEHVRIVSLRLHQGPQELGIRAASRTTPAAMRCTLQGVDKLWGASQWRADCRLKDLGCLWAMVHMSGAVYLQVVLRAFDARIELKERSSTWSKLVKPRRWREKGGLRRQLPIACSRDKYSD
jgi:hypothetical protein